MRKYFHNRFTCGFKVIMRQKGFYLKVQTGFKVTASHLNMSWNAERWCLLWPCQVHWSGCAFHVCRLQGQGSLWFLGLWEGQSSQAALAASSALWSMAFQFGVIIPDQAGRLVTSWSAMSAQRCINLRLGDYMGRWLVSPTEVSYYFQKFHCLDWNDKWMPTVSSGKESGQFSSPTLWFLMFFQSSQTS